MCVNKKMKKRVKLSFDLLYGGAEREHRGVGRNRLKLGG